MERLLKSVHFAFHSHIPVANSLIGIVGPPEDRLLGYEGVQ